MACQLGGPVCLTPARHHYQFAGVINLDDRNAAPNSRSRTRPAVSRMHTACVRVAQSSPQKTSVFMDKLLGVAV